MLIKREKHNFNDKQHCVERKLKLCNFITSDKIGNFDIEITIFFLAMSKKL